MRNAERGLRNRKACRYIPHSEFRIPHYRKRFIGSIFRTDRRATSPAKSDITIVTTAAIANSSHGSGITHSGEPAQLGQPVHDRVRQHDPEQPDPERLDEDRSPSPCGRGMPIASRIAYSLADAVVAA